MKKISIYILAASLFFNTQTKAQASDTSLHRSAGALLWEKTALEPAKNTIAAARNKNTLEEHRVR